MGYQTLRNVMLLVLAMGCLSACSQSPLRVLDGVQDEIVDAEFSIALERAVLVGKSLWIVQLSGEATEVELPWDACNVSVYKDHAAVSHDGYFSLVDLKAGVVKKTEEVKLRCPEVILGPRHIYILSTTRRSTPSFIAKRPGLKVERAFDGGVQGRADLHRSRRRIYGVENDGNDTVRYNLKADGSPKSDFEFDSSYHYDYPVCPDVWLSTDGQRLFNACGSVFSTRGKMLERGRGHDNPSPDFDQVFLDRLPMGNRVRSMCDTGRVLVTLPGTETIDEAKGANRNPLGEAPIYDPATSPLLIIGSQNYQLLQEVELPRFPDSGTAPQAEHAFCIDADRAAVLVRQGEVTDRWGLVPVRFVDE